MLTTVALCGLFFLLGYSLGARTMLKSIENAKMVEPWLEEIETKCDT